jgi:hypothetical protein
VPGRLVGIAGLSVSEFEKGTDVALLAVAAAGRQYDSACLFE